MSDLITSLSKTHYTHLPFVGFIIHFFHFENLFMFPFLSFPFSRIIKTILVRTDNKNRKNLRIVDNLISELNYLTSKKQRILFSQTL